MKKQILAVLLLSSVILISLLFFNKADKRKSAYVSPLPDFLVLEKNRQATLLDLWLPFLTKAYGKGYDMSEVTAKSYLIYDLTSNKIVFERNPKKRLPMASLTKIMTAIITLENKRSDDKYEVKESDLVGEDSMGLVAGEVLTQEELLYGLLMQSGNDAAEVLSSNYPHGGRSAFIQAMNDKARALGLNDTHFDNPTGLQGDGVQYTTAYDLLVITQYALDRFPLFGKIVSTYNYSIEKGETHQKYDLVSETNLLSTYPGVKGVKTGYTPEAGLCLVTYLDYGNNKVIGILLNSEDRRGEMKKLLDSTLESLGITPPPYSG